MDCDGVCHVQFLQNMTPVDATYSSVTNPSIPRSENDTDWSMTRDQKYDDVTGDNKRIVRSASHNPDIAVTLRRPPILRCLETLLQNVSQRR
jgi:hypothetical protein